MILFSFAGNMDVDKFATIVPSAKKIGIARLPGYNFIFNRTDDDLSSKANILHSDDPNDSVWGVLIKLNDEEWPNFYNVGSYKTDFKLETVNCVDVNDKIHTAWAFVAEPHAVNTHLLPYDWHHKKVLQLAKNAGLPEEYIYKISLMPFKIDPDDERRQEELSKIKS
jgi:hypothetical protein